MHGKFLRKIRYSLVLILIMEKITMLLILKQKIFELKEEKAAQEAPQMIQTLKPVHLRRQKKVSRLKGIHLLPKLKHCTVFLVYYQMNKTIK